MLNAFNLYLSMLFRYFCKVNFQLSHGHHVIFFSRCWLFANILKIQPTLFDFFPYFACRKTSMLAFCRHLACADISFCDLCNPKSNMHHKKPTTHLNITSFVTLRHALLSNRRSRGKKANSTAPPESMIPNSGCSNCSAYLNISSTFIINPFTLKHQRSFLNHFYDRESSAIHSTCSSLSKPIFKSFSIIDTNSSPQ